MRECRCKLTGLIPDKRCYMKVRGCPTHQAKDEPEPTDDEWESDDWEDDEFADN